MDWDGIDLREYERLEGNLVPDCFKNFYIEQGTGKKIKVKTTDFTIKGIRLLIPMTSNELQTGDGLIISPVDESYQLIGEVIYVVSVNNDTLCAGIRFLRTKSLSIYIQIIEDIKNKNQHTIRF